MILVAEDNDMMVKALVDMLYDYAVETVEDGEAFLAAASARPYKLIIADVNLPKIDGATVVKKIRNVAGPNQETTILAITGDFDPSFVNMTDGAGFTDILQKPIGLADFRYRVAEALK